MTSRAYYNRPVEELEMYQRLIEYWSVMFDSTRGARSLDHMNFNRLVYPPALTLTEIEKVVDFEPGYASPDGSVELDRVIRFLELVRLNRVIPNRRTINTRLVKAAGLGSGHGCTNVMSGILNTLPRLPKTVFPRQNSNPEIILTLPNYTVYVAQISNMAGLVKPRFVRGSRSNGFLPSFTQVRRAVNKHTIGVVITYPNNPAQSTYEGERVQELQKIVRYCQAQGIFLVVDNIYQDELYPKTRRHTEVLSLTNRLDYIVKVFGLSKDTAFFAGYRCGYWFGDPRIKSTYQYYISATENTINTVSMIMLAWDCLFRARRFLGTAVKRTDLKLLDTGLFGWGRPFDQRRTFDKLRQLRLFKKYNARVDRTDALMGEANKRVREYVEQSPYFSDQVNDGIGNVLLIKVNPDYWSGDDDDLFHALIKKAKIGILPGNVFGMIRRNGDAWFRITLIHDTWQRIIDDLNQVERFLEKQLTGKES